MKHCSAWLAVGVAAIVMATGLAMPQHLKAAEPPALQKAESKQPSQADVEAQLARMLDELRRENARRGITEILTPPPPPVPAPARPASVATAPTSSPVTPAPVQSATSAPSIDVIAAPSVDASEPATPATVVFTAPVAGAPAAPAPPTVIAPSPQIKSSAPPPATATPPPTKPSAPPAAAVIPPPVASPARPAVVVRSSPPAAAPAPGPLPPPAPPVVAPAPPVTAPAPPVAAPVADAPLPIAAPVVPSGVRSPLPVIEGFIAADVQSLLGVPSTVQQGPRGTVMWHYLTPNGRQFVYFVDGIATVAAPAGSGARAVPPRRTPGVQGACEGVAGTTGFKTIAVINPDSPVFIEPKFRTQPLTLLPTKKTAEVVSAEGPWYLIRFNDERWGPRVGYIHCSDVIRQDK